MSDKSEQNYLNDRNDGIEGYNNVREPTIGGPDLSNRLRQAMSGTRRQDLIRLSGVSHGTLNRILRGQPTRVRTVKSLAETLQVRQDWLIFGTGEMRSVAAPNAAQTQPKNDPTFEERLNSIVISEDYDETLRLTGRIHTSRMGAAIRMALRLWRDAPIPKDFFQETEAWVIRAKQLASLYDALADQSDETDRREAAQDAS